MAQKSRVVGIRKPCSVIAKQKSVMSARRNGTLRCLWVAVSMGNGRRDQNYGRISYMKKSLL